MRSAPCRSSRARDASALARMAPAALVDWDASNPRSRRSGSSSPPAREVRASSIAAWLQAGRVLCALVTESVRALAQGVRRHERREAEVRGPGRVDDEWHARIVRGIREAGDVGAGPDVRRIAEDDSACVGVGCEGGSHRRGRHGAGQSGGGVDLWPHPDRPQSREHDSQQQRAVQGARDHDRLAGASERQHRRLVGVGRPADREPCEVDAPRRSGPSLGVGEHPTALLHRVQPADERDIAADDLPDQVGAVLVAGDREGGDRTAADARLELEPGVQERRVVSEAQGIPRV